MLLCLSGFQPAPPTIILHNESLAITPKEFYIADVVDERADRTAIAKLLPSGGSNNKTYPVDLAGGGFVAIKQFIIHNVPRNNKLRPIVIRIKKFMATESPSGTGMADGKIEFVMGYDLRTNEGELDRLADYHGTAKYNRNIGPPQAIEYIIRGLLKDALVYLNSWMDEQAGTNIKLAKEVKLSFSDYNEKNEGDTIYYSTKRPLTFADFKAPVPSSKYAAEVFPGFGYQEHAVVIKGIVEVAMNMKTYLPKSASWVRNNARTDLTLNHEQRHFDIVKIVVEHFKRKLLKENLPVVNFEGPINVEYLESYREMNTLQKQYDNETNHGLDQNAQQQWNKRIDDELKELGIK